MQSSLITGADSLSLYVVQYMLARNLHNAVQIHLQPASQMVTVGVEVWCGVARWYVGIQYIDQRS